MAFLDETPENEREFVTGQLPDMSGINQFTVILRSRDDPERRPREARQKAAAASFWKTVRKRPAEAWRPEIEAHLGDGIARTFNRIMVELADVTADVAAGESEALTGPLAALWGLVEGGFVEFSMEAPVLFRSTSRRASQLRALREF